MAGDTTEARPTVRSGSSGSGTPTRPTSTWPSSHSPAGTTSAAAGHPLLHLTGVVDHGDDVELAAMVSACAAAGVRTEQLSASEARSRWPGMRFTDPVVHQPDGGRVDADRTLAACWDQAADAGADVRFDTPVAAVRPAGNGVAVTIGDAVVDARVAVVAAAGWTNGLLEPDVARAFVPPITVTAETVAWFRPTTGPWPSFIQRGEPLGTGSAHPTVSSRRACTASAP